MTDHLFENKTISLEDLELHLKRIHEEQSSEFFREEISNMFINLKRFINEKLFNDIEIKELDQNILKNVKVKDYSLLRLTKVPVLTGLNTSYLNFIEVLDQNSHLISTLLDQVLLPYEKYIGSLTRPNKLSSNIGDQKVMDIYKRDLEKAKDKYKKCFSPRISDSNTYGVLIPKQTDWPDIIINFNSLLNKVNKVSIGFIKDKTNQISDKSDIVAENLMKHRDIYEASNVTAKDLAKLSYMVALEVEHYATYLGMLQYLNQSIIEASNA